MDEKQEQSVSIRRSEVLQFFGIQSFCLVGEVADFHRRDSRQWAIDVSKGVQPIQMVE